MNLQLALTQALHGHKEAILAFSQDLIRIATENPPGNHYRECTQRICRELERLGLAHQVVEVPGDPERPRFNVLSFIGEGQRTLYFHGHYDVVPAQSREQFDSVVRKGRLYGRGSTDMKAGLAAMIYAAYLLRELKVPLRGRVGLCLVADEETGGRGGSAYLDQIGFRDRIAALLGDAQRRGTRRPRQAAHAPRIDIIRRVWTAAVETKLRRGNEWPDRAYIQRLAMILWATPRNRIYGFLLLTEGSTAVVNAFAIACLATQRFG